MSYVDSREAARMVIPAIWAANMNGNPGEPAAMHWPVLDFGPEHLLPSVAQVRQLEEDQLWHLENILLDFIPALRRRLGESFPPPPAVLPIPLHRTEQYPLPAMHIDESSLDGTIDVMDTIFRKTLNLSDEDIRKHGLFICAGDQLSISLLDKVSRPSI